MGRNSRTGRSVSVHELATIWAVILALCPEEPRADIVCDLGFKICGSECYDPSTLDCLDSESWSDEDGERVRISVVCPKGMKACGTQCYSTEVCLQKNGDFAACPFGHEQCGDTCFDPAHEQCVEDSLVCGLDEAVCGSGRTLECFTPSEPTAQSRLSPSICTPQGRVCREGQESCGHECYSPVNGTKCFDNRILCHEGRKLCGVHSCYSEALGERCMDESSGTVCKAGEVLCGKFGCYDPNDSHVQCITQEGSHIGVVCPSEAEAGQTVGVCEGSCFDSSAFACFPYRGLGKVCPKGKQGCGGIDCFTPGEPEADDGGHVYECLTNDEGEEVLCKKGQSLCGSTCFFPEGADLKCVRNGDLEILCKTEEELCGTACFDPTTQICYPTETDEGT